MGPVLTKTTTIQLRSPYLIFLGDIEEDSSGKTGKGLVHWCPEKVAGQIRLPGCVVDLGVPDMTIDAAASAGVRSLILGVALIGGQLPDHWNEVLKSALAAGMDIVSGLHTRLADLPELQEIAQRGGARLVDVRVPPSEIPVATGLKRKGKRVLMVGTDCAVGKKYSALALTKSLSDLGLDATFRATGQTGIMLAGEGIAVDAVVADFISGAAELVSPENDPDHWDVIEGQGSLFNPGYAGVSLGLLHGSQPDALVLCHDVSREEIDGWPGYPVPSLDECMQQNRQAAKLTNKNVQFAGISINTSGLPLSDRGPYLQAVASQFNLPCIDPIAGGSQAIAHYLNDNF
jgi:uncharacterized NAD-dependent epimerase/dehydratase family protein